MPLSDPNREFAKRLKRSDSADSAGSSSSALPPIFQDETEDERAAQLPPAMLRLNSADFDSPKPCEAFLRQVFATNALFKNVKTNEVRPLLRNFHRISFGAGVTIMREGELGDRFYVLESGTVDMSTQRDGTVKKGTRGDAFGELALLQDTPRAATVTTDEPSVAWYLEAPAFKQLMITTTPPPVATKHRSSLALFRRGISLVSAANRMGLGSLSVAAKRRRALLRWKRACVLVRWLVVRLHVCRAREAALPTPPLRRKPPPRSVGLGVLATGTAAPLLLAYSAAVGGALPTAAQLLSVPLLSCVGAYSLPATVAASVERCIAHGYLHLFKHPIATRRAAGRLARSSSAAGASPLPPPPHHARLPFLHHVFKRDRRVVAATTSSSSPPSYKFAVGTRVKHPTRGNGTVTELLQDESRSRVLFDSGEEHRYKPSSMHKIVPLEIAAGAAAAPAPPASTSASASASASVSSSDAASLPAKLRALHGLLLEHHGLAEGGVRMLLARAPLLARRAATFSSIALQLAAAPPRALAAGLNVRFVAEPALDAGGVTTELFALLAKQTIDEKLRLFEALEDGTLFLRPHDKPPDPPPEAEGGSGSGAGGASDGGGGGAASGVGAEGAGGGQGGSRKRKLPDWAAEPDVAHAEGPPQQPHDRRTPLLLYESLGRLIGCFLCRACAQAAEGADSAAGSGGGGGGGSLVLPLRLSGALLAQLLDVPLVAADVRAKDSLLYRFRVDALREEGGIDNVAAMLCADDGLAFVADDDDGDDAPTPLCEGGAARRVTAASLDEYVARFSEHLLCAPLRKELALLLRGVWAVCPLGALREANLGVAELRSLFEGEESLDLDAWRLHARLEPSAGVSAADATARTDAFFGALRDHCDADARRRLFQFATGLPRLPPGGFAQLRPPFTLQLLGDSYRGRLPVAHTCFNALQLAPPAAPAAPPAEQATALAKALATSVEWGEGAFSAV